METNKIRLEVRTSDICKVAIGWYTGKLIFNICSGVVNALCKKATTKLEEETEKIRVLKDEDE